MGTLPRSARWRSLLTGAEGGDAGRTPRVRPGRVWYLVGIVLLVGGIGGGAWSGLVGAPALVDGMDRFDAPGSVVVDLDATGDHTVFHEHPTGTPPTLPALPAFGPTTDVLDIEARPLDGGPAAQVRPMRGSVTYSLGGTDGVGIARLVVPRPGTYEVTVRLPDDAVGGVVALDSQGAMGTRFFGAIAGGVLLGLAGGTLGSLALLLVLVLRVVAKRRVAGAAAGSPPPGSPPASIPPAPGGPPGPVPPPPPAAPPPGRPVDGR